MRPADFLAALIAIAPRFGAGIETRLPNKPPIGVRLAEIIAIGSGIGFPFSLRLKVYLTTRNEGLVFGFDLDDWLVFLFDGTTVGPLIGGGSFSGSSSGSNIIP